MKKILVTILLIITVLSAFSQGVVISESTTDIPDASAILDVKSENKGILIPRVTLQSATFPIEGLKAEGLLVYNDNATFFPKGFYYWTGSSWNQFVSKGDMQVVLTGDLLSVNGINTDLSKYIDDTEITDLGSGKIITDAERTKLNNALTTESQDLDLSGNTLSLTNDNSNVDLSLFLDSKWTQSGNDISFMAAGNVGLGTTTPSDKFEIYNGNLNIASGKISVANYATDNGTYIGFWRAVGAGDFAITRLGFASGGADRIGFYMGNSLVNYRFWVDDAGLLRTFNNWPNAQNAGTVVGAQTSARNTKQDILSYTDYTGALKKVLDAPLNTFKYINEVEGYGSDVAKTRLGFIADEVDPIFMNQSMIDQVSVNGLLMASIKAQQTKIDKMSDEIELLKRQISEFQQLKSENIKNE